ncbi:MAG: insulinase family protein [Clostridia bacterium]|nr:insulinase family protein [Clostridia bacterium]
MKRTVYENPFGDSYVQVDHPSGLKIYLMEKPQFSSAYAVFGTRYGSIDTCFAKNGGSMIHVPEGIAHYLEHKLFESEDGDAFNRYAETGGYANAYTSFDRTCYLFSCTNRFEDNLAILLDFVQSPYFTEETVAKEQGIIGQEIRMYDDSPAWCVLFNLLKTMYTEHPVRIDIAGTVESIAEINAELLYQCYETFYNPSNMFLCIVGNFDTEKTLRQINAAIKPNAPVDIERGTFSEPDTVATPYIEQRLAVSMPLFCFGYKHAIKSPVRSLKTRICMALLLELICGDASPLYARLIRDGYINDEFEAEYFHGHGYAAVLFEGESRDPQKVADAIAEEIERLKTEGIDKKLFAAVKRGMYGDAIRRFDNIEGLATQLTECAVADLELFEELKLLKSITIDDVLKRLALFQQDKCVLSVILPQEETEGESCTK